MKIDLPTVPPEIENYRFNICKSCDKYITLTNQCKRCGCFVSLKVKLQQVRCPDGKWEAYDG
jgi:hypothetical protein